MEIEEIEVVTLNVPIESRWVILKKIPTLSMTFQEIEQIYLCLKNLKLTLEDDFQEYHKKTTNNVQSSSTPNVSPTYIS